MVISSTEPFHTVYQLEHPIVHDTCIYGMYNFIFQLKIIKTESAHNPVLYHCHVS